MTITETISRECCADQDLKPVGPPAVSGKSSHYFCIHCGRYWATERRMDAAGSMESIMVKLPWPWHKQ